VDIGADLPDICNRYGEVSVRRIGYVGNANDRLIVRDGSITGQKVVDILVVTANHMEYVELGGDSGLLIRPCIDCSECTKAGTELAIIELA